MSASPELKVGGGSSAYGDANSTSYMLLKGGAKKKAAAKKAIAAKKPVAAKKFVAAKKPVAVKKPVAAKKAVREVKKGGEGETVPLPVAMGGAGSCAYADAKGGKKSKGGNADVLGDLTKMMPSNISGLFNQMGEAAAPVQAPSVMVGGKKGGSFEVAPFAAALTLLAVRAVNDKQFTEKVKSVASRLTGQEGKKKRKNKRKSQKKPVM
jgi:hypothetical protein